MLVVLLVLECIKKSGAGELNVATIRGIHPHWSSTVGMFGLEERSVGIILWRGTIIQKSIQVFLLLSWLTPSHS